MAAQQTIAVERFAHALAQPLAEREGLPDIEAGTERMKSAVDEVIARFQPTPDLGEKERENRYKVVDGLVAMISEGITEYAALTQKVADEALRFAMYDAHDAMVNDYYRLIALRAELDPEAGEIAAVIDTPQQLHAWFDEITRG